MTKVNVNNQIRSRTVRLVDHTNEGVLDLKDALSIAKESGLDLIEIPSKAQPPIVRIVDYGKWSYEKQKAEKKAKQAQKKSAIDLKELRFGPNTSEHDIGIMLNKATKFIEEGKHVKFSLRAKGRESQQMQKHRDTLTEVISKMDVKIVSAPKIQGRQVFCVISSK